MCTLLSVAYVIEYYLMILTLVHSLVSAVEMLQLLLRVMLQLLYKLQHSEPLSSN